MSQIFIPAFNKLSERELSRLEGALRRDLVQEMSVEKATYAVRQGMIAQGLKEEGPRKTRDGLGQLKYAVDARTWFRWDAQEPGCWNDRKWVENFLKKNPECRAPDPEKKATIIV